MLCFVACGLITRTSATIWRIRPNVITAIVILALCGVLVSCASSSKLSGVTQTSPNIAGQWEFIAVSNDGSITGIEVALNEAQVLQNGVEVPNGQISANSTQIAFVSLATVSQNLNITAFGGSCGATPTSANSLGPGTVTGYGSPVSFTFTENGNVFNVTTTLSGDGQSMLSGTYTPQSGNINTCSDPGGTITGAIVSPLPATFTGQMCPLASVSSCSSQSDSVTATVTTHSGQINLSLALQGTDNTSFTLTGPITGNAFRAQGTYQGQTLVYYGYFESVGTSSVPSIYLVNAADACFSNSEEACTTATVLALQQNPE
jgi:hypothetical protein